MATPNSTNPNTPSLSFVMLYVADLDQATAYLESLGFRYVPEESTPFFREFLDGSNAPFAILRATPETAKPGTVQLYFKTPDLNALHAAFSGNGTQVSPLMQRPFGTIFDIPALDGHLLTMQQA